MAKKNSAKDTTANNTPVQPPAGMTRRGGDIDGFWTGAEPLHFIPREAKLFDSSQDKMRPSVLIIGELVSPITGVTRVDGEDMAIDMGAGDIVGVWGKTGMKALTKLAGVEVFMKAAGEKDVGKAKPMKLFEIFSGDGGEQLEVTEDRRDHSMGQPTFLDPPPRGKVSRRQSPATDDDDIPWGAPPRR